MDVFHMLCPQCERCETKPRRVEELNGARYSSRCVFALKPTKPVTQTPRDTKKRIMSSRKRVAGTNEARK